MNSKLAGLVALIGATCAFSNVGLAQYSEHSRAKVREVVDKGIEAGRQAEILASLKLIADGDLSSTAPFVSAVADSKSSREFVVRHLPYAINYAAKRSPGISIELSEPKSDLGKYGATSLGQIRDLVNRAKSSDERDYVAAALEFGSAGDWPKATEQFLNAFKGSSEQQKLVLEYFPLAFRSAGGDLKNPELDVSDFSYTYRGKKINLTPRADMVAIFEGGQDAVFNPEAVSLDKDIRRLSNVRVDDEIDYGVFGLNHDSMADTWSLNEIGRRTERVVQPVFSRGQALLIPNNEIIVGFPKDQKYDIEEVKERMSAFTDEQKIIGVYAHRRNSFRIKIDDASRGRSYAVAKFLTSNVEGTEFVEPCHNVLFFDDIKQIEVENDAQPLNPIPIAPQPLKSNRDNTSTRFEFGVVPTVSVLDLDDESETEAEVTPDPWVDILRQDFESDGLAGWTTGSHNTKEVHWHVQSDRSHDGTNALYASGGGRDGKAAPGPYPDDSFSYVETPALDFSNSTEVYVELWFHANYEHSSAPGPVSDFGAVFVRSGTTLTRLGILAVSYTGDLTLDQTTEGGWRRALFRVPPSARLANSNVQIQFRCDASGSAEGLYVDDIRVASLRDWSLLAAPSDDTYSNRQYELRNLGQIAGLGSTEHDMQVTDAWEIAGKNYKDIVVAVIDDGVDLGHPDLNLTPGFDWNGQSGGGARGSHGTACAGNVGAIGGNSKGVVGVAPGVKIMPIYHGGHTDRMAKAIDLAVDKGAKVLSNSWGWVGLPSRDIEDAIDDAIEAGRIVVFAAGNGPDRAPFTYDVAFPGSLNGNSEVICVGACSPTDEHKATASSDGTHSWGSSYLGTGPDVLAQSPWSYTTDRQGSRGYNAGSEIEPNSPDSAHYTPDFGGTSSATPKVAGVIALMLGVNPDLKPCQVKTILRASAEDIGSEGVDNRTGAGRVDALRAVAAAKQLRRD